MNSRRTSTPMLGLPKCPLCGHEVAISVLIEQYRDAGGPGDRPFRDKPVGVDGTCGNCGFRAQRKVEEHLRGATVETVLLECPDEPEPQRMAEFEEFADDWIAGYSGKPLPRKPINIPIRDIYAKVPVSPPLSAGTFYGNPGGGKSRTMFDFGASMKVEFDDIVMNSKLFDDALVGMKKALDDQIFKSLMYGSSSMRVPLQGKTPKPKHDPPEPYTVTFEFLEDTIKPLMVSVKLLHEDLVEMERAGLIKVRPNQRTIEFWPTKTLPFDGSPEAIAAEFRIRKLFLQARKAMKQP